MRDGPVGVAVPKRLRGMTPSHARARAQEAELAGRTGGVPVRGSGSGHVRGDVRLKGVARVEAKTTVHSSFRVTSAMLAALDEAVAGTDEVPVVVVELEGGGPGAPVAVVMPGWALDLVLEAARAGRGRP